MDGPIISTPAKQATGDSAAGCDSIGSRLVCRVEQRKPPSSIARIHDRPVRGGFPPTSRAASFEPRLRQGNRAASGASPPSKGRARNHDCASGRCRMRSVARAPRLSEVHRQGARRGRAGAVAAEREVGAGAASEPARLRDPLSAQRDLRLFAEPTRRALPTATGALCLPVRSRNKSCFRWSRSRRS
jgi:hypothetical protein